MSGLSRKAPASKSRASAGRADMAAARAVTRSPAAWKSPGPQRRRSGATTIFENLFGYEWELTKSPAGAQQWKPKDGAGADTVPDAHDPSKRHAPSMLTTDLALRFDPVLRKDCAALLRASGSVRRRVRPGVVQADAPRHGPPRALSRPGGPGGRADLARPRPRSRSRPDRRGRHRRAQGQNPGLGAVDLANSSRPPGRRPPPSAAPTSAAARTGRAFVLRRKRIGKSTSRPN